VLPSACEVTMAEMLDIPLLALTVVGAFVIGHER
jgi:hypothetical protein